MASPDTIDFDALLAPVPGDSPAGENLRFSEVFDEIKAARESRDVLVADDPWDTGAKPADWGKVLSLSSEVLTTRSKDLQVGVWMAEGLIHRHGFAGLRDGLRLLRGLHERFWEGLHPIVEDGDLEFRAGILESIARSFPMLIRGLAIFRDDAREYSWRSWEESRDVENLGRKDPAAMQAALADGKLSKEVFDAAVAGAALGGLQAVLEDIEQCCEDLRGLDDLIDEKYGREAPSLSDVKKSLEDCRLLAERLVRDKGGLVGEAEEGETSSLGEDPAVSGGGGMASQGPIRNRHEAFRMLEEVAAFLKATEPHSPVAYLVQRAARWGRMPLNELLEELVKESSVRSAIFELLGIADSQEAS